MKKLPFRLLWLLFSVVFFGVKAQAQNPVNWTDKQLLAPAELAAAITAQKNVPVMVSVGPGAVIPGSVNVGMVNSTEGLQKLKAELKKIDRDKTIVIYCGCCPFEHCPNVRPAIETLKEMKFTNYFLLNLPNNIKRDWIDKGYPVKKS